MGNTQGINSSKADRPWESSQTSEKTKKIQAISVLHMKLRKFRNRRKSREKSLRMPMIKPVNLSNQLLKPDEVRDIQDTLPYVRLHLNAILHDAFINMFALNLDIKAKFFTFKDYSIQDLKIQEGQNNALPRHIQRVSRAFSKVFSKVDDLDSLKDYLHILGKIHQRNGIQNHEMLVMGPHFVASAVRYLPKSWIRFFAVIMKLMSHPIELSTELNSDEKTLIVTCSKQLLEIQKVLGPQMMQQKFQKVWSREAVKTFLRAFNLEMEMETMQESLYKLYPMLLIKVLEDLCPLLESPNALESYFIQLGHHHSDQGVKVQYLDVIGTLFSEGLLPMVIEEGIDYRDEDLKQTWLKFFRISIHYMKMGYDQNVNQDDECSANAGMTHLYAKNYNSSRLTSTSDLSAKAQICKKTKIAATNPDAIEVVSSLDLSQKRCPRSPNTMGSHDYLNRPEMIQARTLRERSISTANILTQKLERMRRSGNSSPQPELVIDEALSEVSKEPFCYEGKMLKKVKVNPNKQQRKRSKSLDATAHYSIK